MGLQFLWRERDACFEFEPGRADKVDEAWQFYRDDAVSILKTMREPDEAAASAGDVATWERMIEAALGGR